MFLPIGLALMKVIFNGKALDVKYEHAYGTKRREKWWAKQSKKNSSLQSWSLAEFVIWANVTHMNNSHTLEQRNIFLKKKTLVYQPKPLFVN